MKLFARKLNTALKNAGLTQKEFAEMLGVSPAQVNHLVGDNRSPSVEMVVSIEKLLKLPSGYLMYDHIIEFDKIKNVPFFDCKLKVDIFLKTGKMPVDVTFTQVFSNNKKDDFMLKKGFSVPVIGNAMTSSGKDSLHDGDVVVIDPTKTPASGSVVLISIRDEMKIRKYVQDGSDIFLESTNRQLPLIKLDDEVKIYGVVIQVSRKI